MYGILFTKDETGKNIRCGICGRNADEGYDIEHENEEEFTFVKHILQDVSNWFVNECCRNKFEKLCSEKGFEFKIRAEPPEELVDESFDIGHIPSKLFKGIELDHEFYVLETKNGDKIWGFLADFNDLDFELNNCFKQNKEKQKWERVGISNMAGKYIVTIPTEDIESIEVAPYEMKSPKDYGFSPFTDKGNKNNE